MIRFKGKGLFNSPDVMVQNGYLHMCACHVLDRVPCPLLLLLLLLQRQLLSRCVLLGLPILFRLLCRRHTRHALHWHNQRLVTCASRSLAMNNLCKVCTVHTSLCHGLKLRYQHIP